MPPLTEVQPVPEKITRRKTSVYKSRVDPTVIKLTAEKMKNKLFPRVGFSKPRPEEIRVVAVDRYYEPYVLVDAKYSVDYYKTRVYTLDVDNETEEVEVLNETFKPEVVVSPTGENRKIIKLEARERFSYEDKAYIILDKTGRELSPDEVPSAPSEDRPQKILKEFGEKSGKIRIPARKTIELVKSKIVKRPSDVAKIENELFQITEHAIIYSPMYEITFLNVKTLEEKTIRIDGITAKIIP